MRKLIAIFLVSLSFMAQAQKPTIKVSSDPRPGIATDSNTNGSLTIAQLSAISTSTPAGKIYTLKDNRKGGTVIKIASSTSGYTIDNITLFATAAGEVFQRQYNGPVLAPWAMVGDNVANDSAGFAALLQYPWIDVSDGTYYVKNAGMTSDQRIQGTGSIRLDSTGVLGGYLLSNIQISGITIIGGNARRAFGVYLDSCTSVDVSRVKFYKCGISFNIRRSTYITSNSNQYYQAASDERFGSPSSPDVSIARGGNHLYFYNAYHRSVGAYAFQVRTDSSYSTTDFCYNNSDIKGYNSYGLLQYKNKNGTIQDGGNILRGVFSGNTIDSISGARSSVIGSSNLIFGAGIYIQGAEQATITYNLISRTNLSTANELLAPAGIGFANSSTGEVAFNIVTNSNWYSYYLNNSLSYGLPGGYINFHDNKSYYPRLVGLKLQAQERVTIDHFYAHGSGGNDILIQNGTSGKTLYGVSITNSILDSGSASGLSANNVNNLIVDHVISKNHAVAGYSYTNMVNLLMTNCTGDSNLVRGTYMDATVTGNVKYYANRTKYNAYGFLAVNPVDYQNNDNDSNTTANFNWVLAPASKLDSSATPNVQYLTYMTVGPTTPVTYTNMLGGQTGQIITIQAVNSGQVTWQNGANIALRDNLSWVMSSNSCITFIKSAGAWIEIARKDNSALYKFIDINGTSGAGFIHLLNQGLVPATPASGINLYGSLFGPAWVNTNGLQAILNSNSNTAARTYVLPDKSDTFAMKSDLGSITGAFTIGAPNSTSNANGLDYNGSVLTAHYADQTNPGLLVPGAQNFGTGTKTTGIIQPAANNTYTLGNSTTAWSTVYGQVFQAVGASTIINSPSGSGVDFRVNASSRVNIPPSIGLSGMVTLGSSTANSVSNSAIAAINNSWTHNSGVMFGYGIYPTLTETSTAGSAMFYASPFTSSIGSGAHYLMQLGTNSAAGGAIATNTNKATIDLNGTFVNVGGLGLHRTTVADAPYTVLVTDYLVAYTTLTATRAVTLPTAANCAGQHFVLKDEAGTGGTNAITIVGTVNGASNPTAISTNYGSYRIYSNGTAFMTE